MIQLPKLKNYQQILIITIIILLLLLITGITLYSKISPKLHIENICKNLQIIDANEDHNQALDVIEYAQKNKVKLPNTIINFDTHSDLYVYKKINPKYGAHIYDWLNEFFAKNPEAEVIYWVMPREEALDKDMQETFIEPDLEYKSPVQGNSQKNKKDVNPYVDKKPYVQYFILNTTNSYMTEITNKKDELKLKNSPKLKRIKLITCTTKTLPKFKNKPVILSIDADYIVNSGYDTTNDFKIEKSSKKIDKDLKNLIREINKKQINPQIISLTLSPKYVPKKHQKQILNFFKYFIEHSGKQDNLKEYSRKVDSKQRKGNEPKYKSF